MEKTNYQKKTDEILAALKTRERLLLHSCCGPCSSYVLRYLREYFDITVFFYNPNILPAGEYEKRLQAQKRLIEKMNGEGADIRLLVPDYDPEPFLTMARGKEDLPEGGERCSGCFRLRLEETAKTARENGFPWFCTTLSVSPHKDAERINRIGEELGTDGCRWLYSDFKKRNGYLESIRLSHEYGLYRQDYCGCTPRKTVGNTL